MDKIYYKGKLILASKLQGLELILGDFKNYGFHVDTDYFLDFLNGLEKDKYDRLVEEFKKINDNETISLANPDFDRFKQVINGLFINNYHSKYKTDIDIIFEVITTKNGDKYGKELHTGLLFPLVDLNKSKYKTMIRRTENVIKSPDKNLIYYVENDGKKFKDDNYYIIFNSKFDKTNDLSAMYSDRSYWDMKSLFIFKGVEYSIISPIVYMLKPIISSFENLDLCEAVAYAIKVADKNEVQEYLDRFSGFIMRGKKKKFIDHITVQYNKNVFNSEIEVKEEIKEVPKPKIEKEPLTLKLENIEYLLALVKQKDVDVYNDFLNEYNGIIDSEEEVLTLTPLTIENLTLLEGKIEIYLNYSKNDINHIPSLLTNLKNEYLNNISSNDEEKTKLTIADIDKINELFLKTKSKYSVRSQQTILKDIAFLYIMEILEDDSISISDLENSYFEDNLKYIMVVIMSLIEEDIIESDVFIDYETKLDVYNIFSIIRNLKLKKNKVKQID